MPGWWISKTSYEDFELFSPIPHRSGTPLVQEQFWIFSYNETISLEICWRYYRWWKVPTMSICKVFWTVVWCLLICYQFRYQVEKVGQSYEEGYYGMVLYFLEEVHVTTSHLKIEPLSLIARIGGIIGVGQAFGGVINFLLYKIVNVKNKLLICSEN